MSTNRLTAYFAENPPADPPPPTAAPASPAWADPDYRDKQSRKPAARAKRIRFLDESNATIEAMNDAIAAMEKFLDEWGEHRAARYMTDPLQAAIWTMTTARDLVEFNQPARLRPLDGDDDGRNPASPAEGKATDIAKNNEPNVG